MAQFEILTYLTHLYTVTLDSRETLLLTNGIKRSDSTCTHVSQGIFKVSWYVSICFCEKDKESVTFCSLVCCFVMLLSIY